MSNPKLALIPSGYKSGKVYSILPNDATGDFEFERQSIGTRVRKDGLIEEAKTVGSITNELLYSEDFTQSNWFNSSSTDSISTVVSPDGASLSTLLTSTASNGGLADFNEWSTAIKTASIYVKKNTSSTFRISNLSSPSNDIVFNLDSGTVQSVGGNFSGQIISLPNGWFRCIGTHQGTSSQTLGFTIPTSGQSVYVWGAMLSEGALSDYIKTEGSQETKTVETFTDVPRLDWLNSNCPSLLLESQRTNLQVYSEQFDNSAWSKSNSTIETNSIISPNGELSADKLVDTTTSAAKYIQDIAYSLSTSSDATFSIFLKQSELSQVELLCAQNGSPYTNWARVRFDVSTLSDLGTTIGDFAYEDFGNGWIRLSITGTPVSTSAIIRVTLSKDGTNGYAGTGTEGIYIFGAQVEQGDYASSYIKTEASTVTRLKDECLNGGDSDLFDITEGSWFIDLVPFKNSSAQREIYIHDGTNDNRIALQFQNNNTQVRYIVEADNSIVVFNSQAITFDTRNKILVTFKENEFKFYINGVLRVTDTSGDVPTGLDTFNFANVSGNFNFEGKVYDTRVYDRVLTNAEAIEITTL